MITGDASAWLGLISSETRRSLLQVLDQVHYPRSLATESVNEHGSHDRAEVSARVNQS